MLAKQLILGGPSCKLLFHLSKSDCWKTAALCMNLAVHPRNRACGQFTPVNSDRVMKSDYVVQL